MMTASFSGSDGIKVSGCGRGRKGGGEKGKGNEQGTDKGIGGLLLVTGRGRVVAELLGSREGHQGNGRQAGSVQQGSGDTGIGAGGLRDRCIATVCREGRRGINARGGGGQVRSVQARPGQASAKFAFPGLPHTLMWVLSSFPQHDLPCCAFGL